MTSPRGVRRNIYPYDASDPNLKWCKDCDYPYMPAGGCETHLGRCLTCCEGTYGATCWSSNAWMSQPEPQARGEIDPAQVQAEIDSLYGPPGGQR